MIVNGIDRAIEHSANKLTVNPNYVDKTYYIYCVLETLILVAFNLFMAFVAAQRFGKICPYCNIDDYNQKEKKVLLQGLSYGLYYALLIFIDQWGE